MKIGFIGDCILADESGVDDALLHYLQKNDFNVLNLEAPFVTSGMPPRRGMGLHQLTKDVELLHTMKVKAVSLANNHMMDFGEEGIEYTIKHLEANGIKCFGAGRSHSEAIKPASIEHNGERLYFYGAMQSYFMKSHFAGPVKGGVAQWENKYFNNPKEQGYHFLFLHWNQEFEDYPEPVSKYFAENQIDRFDAIVGSHSHCLQGIQLINQKPVVYSLGNFLLPHQSYNNTALSGYPEKCYNGMVYTWSAKGDDSVALTEMAKDGRSVSLRKEMALPDYIANDERSDRLLLSYKKYRQFYKKKRQNKAIPVLSRYKVMNVLVFKTYVRLLVGFHKVELKMAEFLDAIGVRSLVKRVLGLFVKRYR